MLPRNLHITQVLRLSAHFLFPPQMHCGKNRFSELGFYDMLSVQLGVAELLSTKDECISI